MKTAFSVYAHPDNRWAQPLREAVQAANGLQSRFGYELLPLPDAPGTKQRVVNVRKLEQRLEKRGLRGLVVCDQAFKDGLVVKELLPDRVYLTAQLSRKGPAPRLYLMYQLAAATLALHPKIDPGRNRKMIHDPPVGCLWDWWVSAKQRTAAMVAARICPSCRDTLATYYEVKADVFDAVSALLEYVRRNLMSGPQDVPNRVLVLHGRAPDWKELMVMLRSFGLEDVDEFNTKPVAGLHVSSRWQEMLNGARFAFAVMTPDDPCGKRGRPRARQNVIHEIGLCHARIGIESTAILLAEGTERFSNVGGINHIDFRKGRIQEKEEEIRDLLVARGLLAPL